MRNSLRLSGMRACFNLLSKSDRTRLILVALLNIIAVGLDLLGVATIGLLGALAVNGLSSQSPSPKAISVLTFLHIDNLEFQTKIAILGLLAAALLISKTVFSVFFTRFYLYFLSRRSAQITSELVRELMTKPITTIKKFSSQELLFGLSTGVNAITMGIIASSIMMVSDIALLVVLIVALIFVDITIALSTLLLFAGIGLSLYWFMERRASKLGMTDAMLSVKSSNLILEILGSYRELLPKNRTGFYESQISQVQKSITQTRAELSFLPNIAKYVIESSVVFGALVISGIQFTFNNSSHAVATLAVFMAAGSRIAPAVLRIQQSAISLKSSLGVAGVTLELAQTLFQEMSIRNDTNEFDPTKKFVPEVRLINTSYRYPDATENALTDLDLTIKPGMQVAIVGGSGAGKSTLVDMMLGLLSPTSGIVEISGQSPSEAIKTWSGKISYLPQTPLIIEGTVRTNISLGFTDDYFSTDQINRALKMAQLDLFIKNLSDGLESQVGENGAFLSGGQRQRLGLARALVLDPELIILDEVTSALDAETESAITDMLKTLKGSKTVIIIAHQLRTIRNADLVVFLENGKITGSGSFKALTKQVPEFERLVALNRL